MSKTPEQMAEEWASSRWYTKHDPTMSERSKVAFLAGYQAAQQWINVKDRLPEDGIPVLAFVFDTMEVGYIEMLITDDHEFHWIGDHNYIDKGHRAVTYWMPLPKPPEAKE